MSSVTLVRYYERQSFKRRITLAFVYAALAAGGVVILAPFIWMLSTAVKVPGTEFIYSSAALHQAVALEQFQRRLDRPAVHALVLQHLRHHPAVGVGRRHFLLAGGLRLRATGVPGAAPSCS